MSVQHSVINNGKRPTFLNSVYSYVLLICVQHVPLSTVNCTEERKKLKLVFAQNFVYISLLRMYLHNIIMYGSYIMYEHLNTFLSF